MKILDIKQWKLVFNIARILPNLHLGGPLYMRFFPRKANIILYITNRCNSRCIICNHWNQQPKVDLAPDIIEKLLASRSVNRNGFLIEGGEAIMHPEIDKIMGLFKGKQLTLLTNGLLSERLLEIVEKYRVLNVCLSFDGTQQTYANVRGFDGYQKVIDTIKLLKDKTKLNASFTVSPFNSFDDYMHVRQICRKQRIALSLNIFSAMKYMGIKEKEEFIDQRYEQLESPYACLYNRWVNRQADFPCLAVRFNAVIRPNGDVALCQYKNSLLGNLYQEPFADIWKSERTISLQRSQLYCNGCWVSSHRAFDVKFTLMMRKIMPSFCRERNISRNEQ